ncbi:DNA-binding response regulator [Agrococcus sp. HG114]|uniref:helix-turn-helix transcriptional regulator n=1 Tax=Agrococcus sp. HG114 TaxID=2969757 RepID=UPI00215A8AB8|nr:DNA-binding response regulator [Agrococcus sp. HG114]MCR8671039.1 DNA-binding response regulator [Agrococcus sp. HG114]
MTTSAAPAQKGRTVSVVAPAATAEELRAVLAAEPSLTLGATAARFADLVRERHFPGDVVVLVEEAGPPLLAHARTAIVAGAAVVVRADVDAPLRESLEASGAVVLDAGASAREVTATAAWARVPSRARTHQLTASERRPRLSGGERRALALYVQGSSTVQVAREMGVGYETAKTFLRRVRAKYAAVDRPAGKRAELIMRAEEDGIL